MKGMALSGSRSNACLRGLAVLMLGSALAAASAQSDGVTIGNGFTPDQEVQLGRESAAVVRRLLPLLRNPGIDGFVKGIGRRLADGIPADVRRSTFRYSFDVLNVANLFSYALPGGFIFVSRGMIETAPTEGALAGLLAHQLSHIALRHGAIQRTRGETFEPGDLTGQTLGGIMVQADDEPVFLGSTFRVSAYFLKYDIAFEREANLLGAEMMARAGYDPRDTVAMFTAIARTSADRGDQAWIESHPDSDNRVGDAAPKATSSPTGQFESIRARLRVMAPAPRAEEAARAQARRFAVGPVGSLGVVVPSGESRPVFVGNVLQMNVPANWRRLSGKSAVVFAPADALVASQGGLTAFTHGVQVGIALSPTGDLEGDATALLQHFGRTHPQFQWRPAYQRLSLGGRRAAITAANNLSAVTRQSEYVSVSVAHLRDGRLLYVIGIAPQIEAGTYRGAFNQIRQSITFLD
ncbi:MAG: M48 family metalloprotease [Acidobacteria bacterium]|nr:M48 family metalloprotease [Acidobacteriota bacterium]